MAYEDSFNPLIDLYGQTLASDLPPEALQQVDELQKAQMARGLARAPEGSANPLTYSGPIAGYTGPLSPQDLITDDGRAPAIPVYGGNRLTPDSAEGMMRNLQFAGGKFGRVMDLLGGLPKGLSDKVQQGILEQAIPGSMSNLHNQERQDKLDDFRQRREMMRLEGPAKPGVYLDEQGTPYSPQIGADVQPKTTYYQKDSPQAKVWSATGMINTHIDQTLDALKGIAQNDTNKFSQYLNTELRRIGNNPDVNALKELLGPATALAVGNAYAAGGTSMRGGVRMAEMFKNGVYSESDTLKSSLGKLKRLAEIQLDSAKHSNLHPSVIQSIQDRIKTIFALAAGPKATGGAGPQPGTVIKGYRFKGGNPADQSNWEKAE